MFKLFNITAFALCMTIMGCTVDDATDAEKYTKPTVNAGSDQLHTLPVNKITLRGTAKTYPDGIFKIKTKEWTQTSGPQQLSILNRDELTATLINLDTAGTYIFELYVKDSAGRTNADKVKIIVQPPASIESAQQTLGFEDDYEAMWNTVAEEYAHFDEIEQEWNKLYQHYLIQSQQINTDSEWERLLQDITNELKVSNSARQAAKTNRQLSETPSVMWRIDNGTGVIEFRHIGEMPLDQLEKETLAAIRNLAEVTEINLSFISTESLNQQSQLNLMSSLTINTTQLCIRNKAESVNCIDMSANPVLNGQIITFENREQRNNVSMLHEYLSLHEHGLDSYVVKPPLPIIR